MSDALPTTGTIALQGGGPFTANDDLDTRLIASVIRAGGAGGAGRVVVLPTADAFEDPQHMAREASVWAERLQLDVESLMVLRRSEAMAIGTADMVRAARAVYLVGDQPLHQRAVLKDTPVWEAIIGVLAAGGLVVGVGAAASGLCDPMVDPRGGAFTLGLGLVPDIAVVTEVETWSAERLHRTLGMADTTVACVPTGAAIVRRDGIWETVGEVTVHGELP